MTRAATVSRPEPTAPGGSAVWRLADPATFAALAKSQVRSRSGPLSVAWVPGPMSDPPRVAYAIGKPIGGAVVRNRLRRRLRVVVSELHPGPGCYLIGARPAAAFLPSSDLKALVSHALQALPDNGATR